MKSLDELTEILSKLEHDQWMEWSKDIADKEKISSDRLARWKKLWIPYDDLSEDMKEEDRKYARKIIKELQKYLRT